MITLGWVAVACAAIPAALFVRNLRAFRGPQEPDTFAAVSILIPARNEEINIAAAVEAALQNRNAEVLVLDDGSTDRTAEIVAGYPQVRLLRGRTLPAGWHGKNFACAQLAAAASRPWLLFVDADVRLAPDAAATLAHAMRSSGVHLLSGIPRQELGTLSERLLVPLIHFTLLGFLPLHRMRRSSHPAYGTACGQLIMIDRSAYEQSGGHGAIRGSVHDGLQLPKVLRRSGFRTDLIDVTEIATCRMYRRNAQVWHGLSKNAHEGLGAPARIVPVTLLLFAGQVLPFVLLFTRGWRLGAVAAVLALLPRVLAAKRFHQPLGSVMLHPLGIAALLGIQWAGLLRYLRGKPAMWKGRSLAGDGVTTADAGEQVPQRVQHAID